MSVDLFKNTAIAIALMAIISGCAPTGRVIENHSYNADLTGLKLNQSYAPTIVYTRPNTPTFEAYTRFIVDPVIVNYDDPSMEDLDPNTVAKMQTYFRDSLIKSLREGGYKVGTRTEPNTLRISLHLSGLKAPSAAANITSAIAPFAISVGEVTVEAQFREAVTNRLDIVAVSKTQGSRVVNAKLWSTWADIELDNFKPINDTYGHDVGDKVLRTTANRITACLRKSGSVFRIGGDKFIVLLEGQADEEGVNSIAENIIESVSNTITIKDYSCQIGASIGVAFYPEHGNDIDVLTQKADKAMYKVKHSGRNNVSFAE